MSFATNVKSKVTDNFQGVLVALVVAISAQFLAEHYGAPAMLMALLLGIALNFLAEEGKCTSGITFSASILLRIGVALLGVRVSVELLQILKPEIILIVICGVFATIIFSFLGAKLLGRGWRLAILTGGSVAICGASAAMAIAAVLPKNEHSERNLSFTIVSVTVLSTIAMIIYPPVMQSLDFNNLQIGIFLGGTIHDVAQVVGAGFSISEDTGEIATVVKLMRVSMLAPIVLLIAICARAFAKADVSDGQKPPIMPYFIIGFLALATLN
ncbi:MAG: putative sulfate exporter family transporter, partial [Pseudomonadota bacterium]